MTSETDLTSNFKTLTTDATPLPASDLPNNPENPTSVDDNLTQEYNENETPAEEEVSGREEENSGADVDREGLPGEETSIHKLEENIVNTSRVNTEASKRKKPDTDTLIKPKTGNDDALGFSGNSGTSVVNYNISNANNVRIGAEITVNLAGSKGKSPQMAAPKKSKEISELLNSTVPITDEDIDIVSPHIGHGWRKFGRQLKFTDGQLDQFEANFQLEGRKEVIHQMLLDWKRVKTDGATRGVLCQALWSAKQYDPVRILARAAETT